MTVAGCAAWAQAWGTVLAVVGAIGIAWHQRRQESRVRREDHKKRLRVIGALIIKTKVTVGTLQTANDTQHLVNIDTALDDLEDCAKSIDRLPLLEYPDADLVLQLSTLPRLLRDVGEAWRVSCDPMIVSTIVDEVRLRLPGILRTAKLSSDIAEHKCLAAIAAS